MTYNKILDNNKPNFESDKTIEGKKTFFQKTGFDRDAPRKAQWAPTNEDQVLDEGLAAEIENIKSSSEGSSDEDREGSQEEEYRSSDDIGSEKRVYNKVEADMYNSSFDEDHMIKRRN